MTTIYHNPRCSKSRQTLDLLQKRGIDPEIILYLESPPDAKTLQRLCQLLEIGPRELLRTTEDEYRDNNLADRNLSDRQLINAMVEYPRLIQRPIVVEGNRAAIGRPPEAVLALFK